MQIRTTRDSAGPLPSLSTCQAHPTSPAAALDLRRARLGRTQRHERGSPSRLLPDEHTTATARHTGQERGGKEYSLVLHFGPTRRLGVLNADAIVILLAPNTALAFGPPAPALDLLVPDTYLDGDTAEAAAKTFNDEMLSSTMDVIIRPPQGQTSTSGQCPRPLPPPGMWPQRCCYRCDK